MQLEAPLDGPWGAAGAVVVCLAPIAFLLVTTLVKPLILPSRASLPLAAGLMAAAKLAYLSADPREVAASLGGGALQALVPLSVVLGAISLFQSMQVTKCLPFLMYHLKQLSMGCPVAETFLVGWAFAYIIEGIGGFGAPVALGAPMLVALGHEPLPAVVALVILNCLASHLGTVGMMVWFSFGSLGLGSANLVIVGGKAAILVGVPAFLIAPLAASFLAPWADIRRAWLFIFLSVASAVAPTIAVAVFNHDVPIVIGGICSFLVTAAMIKFRIGLGHLPGGPGDAEAGQGAVGPCLSRAASRALALKAAAAEALAAATVVVTSEPPASEPSAAPARTASGRGGDVEPMTDVVAIAPCGPLSGSVVVVSRGASAPTRRASGGGNSGALAGCIEDIEAGKAGASFVVSPLKFQSPAHGSARWAAAEFGGAAPDPRAACGSLDTCSMVRLAAPIVTCHATGGGGGGKDQDPDGDVDCLAAAALAAPPPAKQQEDAEAAARRREGPLAIDVPPMSARGGGGGGRGGAVSAGWLSEQEPERDGAPRHARHAQHQRVTRGDTW
ncbi:MAG: L-lactate permease-domain-containing protein [Monoraphidium minutum]|nr:MAG: L-lactate permease-domain-containing protein [Monoraphidium minutum]